MLSRKKYQIDAKVAPVRVSWSETVVQDRDMGHFYVRLTPHVEWATDQMREAYQTNPYDYRKRMVYNDRKSWGYKSNVSKTSPSVLGAMKRNEIAQQGKRIFEELKKEWIADVQKQLRARQNKMTGQRWNKKG